MTFDTEEISKLYDITTSIIFLNKDSAAVDSMVHTELKVGQHLCVLPA